MLRILNAYVSAEDKNKIKEEWEKLCLVCAERRFYLTGDKYSIHTQSIKWLIERISKDAQLKGILGLGSSEQIIEGIKDIIARKNAEIADGNDNSTYESNFENSDKSNNYRR
ncbi:hypothetical protein [Legionella gresilensis]|uniref:hypothetical protein n=1 Tax=Legionella gresilensis TaxID=91823 RepID=UPI0010411A48|nr:hypothetical protein [Legionella gresilensis]